MAANDVQIRIRAEDFASSVLNRVAGSANQTTSSLDSLGRTARGFVFNAAGVAAGIAGFQGLSAAIEGTANSVFNFTKSMETNEIGMAGILSSMTQINGRNLQWNEAIGISKSIIAQLNDEALKTSATSEELVTTFRALLAPGLSAGMKIAEIQELTSVGVNAVKSIGLNNTQLVQELRDLVQGGIQPASSTLATALGLKDKDIKAARESTQGLFNFLMERMQGFEMASMATQNTFQGKIDQIKEGMTRIGSEGTMPLFEGAKAVLNDVANQLIHIETEGKGASLKLKSVTMNQDLINDLDFASKKIIEFGAGTKEAAMDLWQMVAPLGTLVPSFNTMEYGLVTIKNNVGAIGAGLATWFVISRISGMYTSIVAATNTATVANSLLGRSIQTGVIAYQSRRLAAQTAAQAEITAAMGVSATMRSAEAARLTAARNAATVQAATTRAAVAGNVALSIELTGLRAEYMRLGASSEQAGLMQLQAARMAMTGNAVLTAELIAQQRAHLAAAAAARTSGLSIVTAMGRAVSTVKGITSAVFALAGGWAGVAVATGYALYKLYEYYKNKNTIEEKDYTRANVRWNLDKQYWEVERAPDANHMFSYWEDATAAEAEFIVASKKKREKEERAMEKAVYGDGAEDGLATDLKKQSEELMAKFGVNQGGTDTGASAVKAAKEAEKAAKEAKEETAALRNNIIDNTGQFLGRDYGGSSIDDWDKVCTTFIQSIWNAAGVANAEGLTAWAPNWKDNLGGAYHAADGGYQPLPGDAVLVDYDGDGKADHVVMVDENQTGYYAASKPGTQSHHGSDLYGAFGENIMGYGSASEYAGIAPGAKAYDRDRAASFKEAYQLSREMQSGINNESGTDYSQGMYTADQDILSKQHKIGRLKGQGVDTTELTKQLETYSASVKEKVTDKWQQSWQTLKDDTKKAQAEMIGDATVFAEAEYQATVSKLNDERKEREKAVMQNKNDKVAAVAVEQWYSDQLALTQQKRANSYRDENIAIYDQKIESNNLLIVLERKKQDEVNALNAQELRNKIQYLDVELQYATLNKDEYVKLQKEKAEAIKQFDAIGRHDRKSGAGIALLEIQNQQADFAQIYNSTWSNIDNSVNEHFKNILNGNEKLAEGIKGTLRDISRSVTDMFADILYQTYVMQPLKNWFTGLLGSIAGAPASGGGLSGGLSGVVGALIPSGTFGSSNYNPTGGFSYESGFGVKYTYAEGGYHAGGPALVGEEGPELVDFKTPGRVYTARDTQGLLSGGQEKQQPIVIHMNISTPNVESFKRSQSQVMAGLNQAVSRGRRNL